MFYFIYYFYLGRSYGSEDDDSILEPEMFRFNDSMFSNEKWRLAEILGITKEVNSNELKKISLKNIISIKKVKNNLRKSIKNLQPNDINPLPTFSTQKWLQARNTGQSMSKHSFSLKKLKKVSRNIQKSRNMDILHSIASDMLEKATLDPDKMIKNTITGSIEDDNDLMYAIILFNFIEGLQNHPY